MFSLRFFGGFSSQRLALTQATELAPVPLHPALSRELATLGSLGNAAVVPKSLWRSCFITAKPLLFQSVVWNAASALAMVGGVLASREILGDADFSTSALLCVAFLAAELLKNSLAAGEITRRAQLARLVQLHLFSIINRKLLSLDHSERGDFTKGGLKTLVASDVEAIEDFITAAVSNWVPSLVLIVILGPAVYFLTGTLGLLGLFVALAQIPISLVFAHLIERYQRRAQVQQDALTALVGEWVKNIRLVRYLNWDRYFESDIARAVHRFTVEGSWRHLFVCFTYGVSFTWWMLPMIAMLMSAKVLGGEFEFKNFFASVWILTLITNQIQYIPYAISMLGSASAGVRRIQALLAIPDLARHVRRVEGNRVSKTAAPVRVILDEVEVRYGERTVLGPISITFELDRRTAIVGMVGSGKTTLLDVISGERAPTTGNVTVVFSDFTSADLWDEDVYRSYRSSLAIAPQEPFLSNTTMRANIDIGAAASDEEIAIVAEAAQLTPDIALLVHGYDEEVGETGINLSGGQKQRVSIARAFLSSRPILILDDPLSAVDRATEEKLAESIFTRVAGLVLVSHRLDQLGRCERVVTLEEGHIVEDGAPEALLRDESSHFARFVQATVEVDQKS